MTLPYMACKAEVDTVMMRRKNKLYNPNLYINNTNSNEIILIILILMK